MKGNIDTISGNSIFDLRYATELKIIYLNYIKEMHCTSKIPTARQGATKNTRNDVLFFASRNDSKCLV